MFISLSEDVVLVWSCHLTLLTCPDVLTCPLHMESVTKLERNDQKHKRYMHITVLKIPFASYHCLHHNIPFVSLKLMTWQAFLLQFSRTWIIFYDFNWQSFRFQERRMKKRFILHKLFAISNCAVKYWSFVGCINIQYWSFSKSRLIPQPYFNFFPARKWKLFFITNFLIALAQHQCIMGKLKNGVKVANSDKLFLHGFWS